MWMCNANILPSALTLSPEAEAPFSSGDLAISVGVTGVEEGTDADLIFVQVDGSQLSLVEIKVAIGVQFGKHPAYGVFTAGHQAPVQHCKHKDRHIFYQGAAAQMKNETMCPQEIYFLLAIDCNAFYSLCTSYMIVSPNVSRGKFTGIKKRYLEMRTKPLRAFSTDFVLIRHQLVGSRRSPLSLTVT